MAKLSYATVCSGIEAPSIAWQPLGWQPVFFSEIEKFPCRLLAARFPQVPNYGDMIKYKEWPDHAIDLIIGGTPCQSFSIAGQRDGIKDSRGNLALVYLALAEKYRPRWLIWENVPGVLSSCGGRDFAAFLGALEKCGYHAAWRVLDAQFVRVDGFERAVPQRRRRLFLVGYFGDWRPAAEILFERESLRGTFAPCRAEDQEIAGTLTKGLGSGGISTQIDSACAGYVRPWRRVKMGQYADDNIASTIMSKNVSSDKTDLVTSLALEHTKSNGNGINTSGAAYTLGAAGGGQAVFKTPMQVRRLMPVECERLMGFPDDWTDISGASDTARYCALGNSMAVNCIRWLGRRIEQWEKDNA